MKKIIVVRDYSPSWKNDYLTLSSKIWPIVKEHAISIEHVGSTSVPGLAAKPVIDMDIIINDQSKFLDVKKKLKTIGYFHIGDQGVPGREAFDRNTQKIRHHLYVCLKDCIALKNHLILRDHLIQNERDRYRYSELKKSLAKQLVFDIDSYVEGKTSFIVSILNQYGITEEDLGFG